MTVVINGTTGISTPGVTNSSTTTNTGNVTNSGTVTNASTISVGNATPSSSGAGITFPATQSASSDANTLDDYEEGTWTPTWGAAGFTATGASFSNARYVKIGRQVYIEVSITLSGTSGNYAAGDGFNFSGLPFVNANICSAGTVWSSTSFLAGTRATGVAMSYSAGEVYVGIEYGGGSPRSVATQLAIVYQVA